MSSIEQKVEQLVEEVRGLKLEVKELKEEIWVPIKDNWNYFISNKGRVKRYDDFYPKISVHKSTGYYCVKLNGKHYKLHRLLAQAFIPNPENKPFVDHIDGDPLNNNLANLRWCTRAENNRNRKKRSDNKSEYTGVYFNKEAGKWRAQIKVDGKQKHLGLFHTPEEAAAVYQEVAQKEFGEFYRKP